MNLRPLYDKIAVRRIEATKATESGIIIAQSAQEKPDRGVVLAVGKGKILPSGDLREMEIKVGDMVLFGKHAGMAVKIDNEDILVLREEDLLGVLD